MGEYRDFLLDLIKRHPFSFSSVLSRKHDDVLRYLLDSYPALAGHPISEYMYWEINGVSDLPKCQCEGCGKPVEFINVKYGYRKCCSIRCTNRSSGHIAKVKAAVSSDPGFWEKRNMVSEQTKLNRYGDKNYNNKEKAKETRYEKNSGRYHPDDFVQKTKATKKDRYGDENYCNKEKARETNERKLKEDSEFRMKSEAKARKTKKDRYGSENYNNSAKAIETNRLNHGGVHHTQTDGFRTSMARRRRLSAYNRLLADPNKQLLLTFEEFEHVSINNLKLKCKCRKCGHVFEIQHHVGNHFPYLYVDCPLCSRKFKHNRISDEEKEFVEFLKSQNVTLYENTRSVIGPLELDVYVPSMKLAFEFDGLYWHSEINKPDRNYHLVKTEMCEENGIRLVHIFENEWKSRRSAVESRIKYMLGIYDRTVYARKCEIREVNQSDADLFLTENSLTGPVTASKRFGLYFGGELIALMTFDKIRPKCAGKWEIRGFCCKCCCHVPGAAGRLLKHFEKTCKPSHLLVCVDRRWSQGKTYIALGFRLQNVSAPKSWYWKSTEFLSDSSCRKNRIGSVLKRFDKSKSVVQNMYDNGYNRIFDCGGLVFVKNYC